MCLVSGPAGLGDLFVEVSPSQTLLSMIFIALHEEHVADELLPEVVALLPKSGSDTCFKSGTRPESTVRKNQKSKRDDGTDQKETAHRSRTSKKQYTNCCARGASSRRKMRQMKNKLRVFHRCVPRQSTENIGITMAAGERPRDTCSVRPATLRQRDDHPVRYNKNTHGQSDPNEAYKNEKNAGAPTTSRAPKPAEARSAAVAAVDVGAVVGIVGAVVP